MKRLGVFIDISNLYYCIGKKFPHRKLSYLKYMDFLADLGEITVARAYGASLNNSAMSFIERLKEYGITPIFKAPKEFAKASGSIRRKADWDVGITVEIIEALDQFDTLILGSADSDMEALINYVIAAGKDVIVFACDVSRDLREAATETFEITSSMLES